MTGESNKTAEITQIALQYRELIQGGPMWSGGPVSPEPAWTWRRSTSHVLFIDQRRCRSSTVFHGACRSGRSRHRMPVRIRYSAPFTTWWWSCRLPQRPLLTGRI